MKDKTAEFILSPMCLLFGGSTVQVLSKAKYGHAEVNSMYIQSTIML